MVAQGYRQCIGGIKIFRLIRGQRYNALQHFPDLFFIGIAITGYARASSIGACVARRDGH